jgi:hypothetical protein
MLTVVEDEVALATFPAVTAVPVQLTKWYFACAVATTEADVPWSYEYDPIPGVLTVPPAVELVVSVRRSIAKLACRV